MAGAAREKGKISIDYQSFIKDDGFAAFACRPARSRGRLHAEPEGKTRDAFHRDRDRIIHSTAFRRLKYKTQVFVYHEGDHYRTRLSHSLEVAQVARSLARSLALNEDLAETCALAHDLGHTPFAHVGEDALKECMEPYGGFDHNDQTLRIVTRLEKRYAAFDGLNLCWETLEGLTKHNGPVKKPYQTTLDVVSRDMDLKLDTFASAEAQVAALADDIAYNSHDLDDGYTAGFFTLQDLADIPLVGEIIAQKKKQFPDAPEKRLLPEVIRELMGRLVLDVMAETQGRLVRLAAQDADGIRQAGEPVVAFSAEMQKREKELRAFLWERFYRHNHVSRMRFKVFKVVQDLFHVFMEHQRCLPAEWLDEVRACELSTDPDNCHARIVADYIAGMTDRYALLEHQRLFDPYRDIR